jgi:hypothetical protein
MLLLVSLTRTNVLLGAIQSSKGLENKAFVPTPSRSPRLNRPANVVTRNVDELNDLSYQQLKQIKKKLRKWCEGTCEFQMFDPPIKSNCWTAKRLIVLTSDICLSIYWHYYHYSLLRKRNGFEIALGEQQELSMMKNIHGPKILKSFPSLHLLPLLPPRAANLGCLATQKDEVMDHFIEQQWCTIEPYLPLLFGSRMLKITWKVLIYPGLTSCHFPL